MKFCKDCTNHQEANDADFWRSPRCKRTITTSSHLNLVSGVTIIEHSRPESCNSERYFGFIMSRIAGECGKEGRFFAPIEKTINPKRVSFLKLFFKNGLHTS